jgi:hypothetical protein
MLSETCIGTYSARILFRHAQQFLGHPLVESEKKRKCYIGLNNYPPTCKQKILQDKTIILNIMEGGGFRMTFKILLFSCQRILSHQRGTVFAIIRMTNKIKLGHSIRWQGIRSASSEIQCGTSLSHTTSCFPNCTLKLG